MGGREGKEGVMLLTLMKGSSLMLDLQKWPLISGESFANDYSVVQKLPTRLRECATVLGLS